MARGEPSDHSWDARSLSTQQQMGTWRQHWVSQRRRGKDLAILPTMPEVQDKCLSNGSPNVRNRKWDSPLPFMLHIFIIKQNLMFRTSMSLTFFHRTKQSVYQQIFCKFLRQISIAILKKNGNTSLLIPLWIQNFKI